MLLIMKFHVVSILTLAPVIWLIHVVPVPAPIPVSVGFNYFNPVRHSCSAITLPGPECNLSVSFTVAAKGEREPLETRTEFPLKVWARRRGHCIDLKLV